MRRALLFLTMTLCSPLVNAQDCAITIQLLSSSGSGWGGNYLSYWVNGVAQPDILMGSGALEEFQVLVPANGAILLVPSMGIASAIDLSYRLIATNGNWLFESGPAPVGSINFSNANGGLCMAMWSSNDCVGAHIYPNGGGGIPWFLHHTSGNFNDLDASNGGCLGQENRGTWFMLPVSTPGALAFTLTPIPSGLPGDLNIDFALYGPFMEPLWPVLPSSLGQPVRCSASSAIGATGLTGIALDASEDVSGDGWVNELLVAPGDYFMLYVDAPTLATRWVTINPTGTASMGWITMDMPDASSPSPWSARPNPANHALFLTGNHAAHTEAFDASGRITWAGTVQPREPIDVSSWPNGAYVLRIGEQRLRAIVAH